MHTWQLYQIALIVSDFICFYCSTFTLFYFIFMWQNYRSIPFSNQVYRCIIVHTTKFLLHCSTFCHHDLNIAYVTFTAPYHRVLVSTKVMSYGIFTNKKVPIYYCISVIFSTQQCLLSERGSASCSSLADPMRVVNFTHFIKLLCTGFLTLFSFNVKFRETEMQAWIWNKE